MKTGFLGVLAVLAVVPRTMAAPDGAAVLIDGVQMPRRDARRVAQVSVEQVINAPDGCVIEIRAGRNEPADFPFDVGSVLEVRLGAGPRAQHLFKGEIVSIEAVYETGRGSAVTVRGYDLSHRLTRTRRTKTFQNLSDGDIAARIAAEHGLRSQVDTTSPSNAWVIQRDESDLAFLQRRAARLGFEVDVEDDVLRFLPAPDPGGEPSLTLAGLGPPLKLVTTDVPGPLEVMVRGWDPVAKKEITGSATGDADQSGPGAAFTLDRGDAVSEEPLLSDGLLFSAAEADAVARAALRRLTARSTTVQGETDGDPRIRAGALVELTGVGQRFEGMYFVAKATHKFDGGGYVTQVRLARDAEKP